MVDVEAQNLTQKQRIRVKLVDTIDLGAIKCSISNVLFENDWDRTYEILRKYEVYDESVDNYVELEEYFWEMCVHTAGEDIENNRVYVLAGVYYEETRHCGVELFIFEIENGKRE